MNNALILLLKVIKSIKIKSNKNFKEIVIAQRI